MGFCISANAVFGYRITEKKLYELYHQQYPSTVIPEKDEKYLCNSFLWDWIRDIIRVINAEDILSVDDITDCEDIQPDENVECAIILCVTHIGDSDMWGYDATGQTTNSGKTWEEIFHSINSAVPKAREVLDKLGFCLGDPDYPRLRSSITISAG